MNYIYHPFYTTKIINGNTDLGSIAKLFLDECEINNIPENITDNKLEIFKNYIVKIINHFYRNKVVLPPYEHFIKIIEINIKIIFKVFESDELIDLLALV